MGSTTNQGGRGGAAKTEKKVSVGCDKLKRFVITSTKLFRSLETFGASSGNKQVMKKCQD